MNRLFFFKNIDELKRIGEKYDGIYLYGAGLYGKVYKQILDSHLINVVGFLVSNKTVDEYCGLNVFEARQKLVELSDDCCVVLSLSRRYHDDILLNQKFYCDVYCVDEEYENAFLCMPFFHLLEKVGKQHNRQNDLKLNDGGEILVVQIEFTFGDIIWSTAFIRELRLNNPNSTITLVINRSMLQLMSVCPYIDEILPFSLERNINDISPNESYENCKEFCANINKYFDAVFLPRLLPYNGGDLWENVFISQCVQSKYVFSHALTYTPALENVVSYYEPYFSMIVQHYGAEHEAKRHLSLVLACGGMVKNEAMELWTDFNSEKYAKSILNTVEQQIYIAVAVVGSKPVRSWSASKYNELFRKIKKYKKNVKIVLCGGADAREAAAAAAFGNEDVCIDVTDKTNLLQAAAVIKHCVFYIGSDTGLMHMAAAFGRPIIMISHSLPDSPPTYGSSPTRTGPWCVPNIVYRPPHALGICRYVCLEKKAHCINLIEVEDVFEGVVKFIDIYGR